MTSSLRQSRVILKVQGWVMRNGCSAVCISLSLEYIRAIIYQLRIDLPFM